MNKRESYKVGSIDIPYLVLSVLIAAIGLLTMISAYAGKSFRNYRQEVFGFAIKELAFVAAGVIIMVIIIKLDWKFFLRGSVLFYGITLVLMLLTWMFGTVVYGAKRWLFGMQPSEFVKITLILIMAKFIYEWSQSYRESIKGSLKMLIFVAPMAFIAVVGQSHLSVTIIYLMITALMLLASGVNRLLVTIGVVGGIPGLIGIIFLGASFRADRIEGWLHPFEGNNTTGTSWQVVQSLYAIASGGLFGRGYTQSREKYAWLPMADNDYIFSVFAEECGFIICTLVIILFAAFIWRGIVIATHAPNTFLSMVAFGVTMMFAVQIFLNICIVCNVLPPTGIQLPFFSSGGTSLWTCMAGVGLVLNVSRYKSR
ncbi:MAG: FtsW/RodA/SpoVE family cell cycle protein [Clostridia bacterium]|nr:FtsW/RodA/SpoVE family cell cycle protein [Clostridia bacterium]